MVAMPFRGKRPVIDKNAWIADDATIIGDVHIGEKSSVWFHAVVRGDINAIRLGRFVNIQDGAVVHVGPSEEHSTEVGDYVSVGHHANLHGCKIQNQVLIGIGAIVLNGATVESGSIVAAGALVRSGDRVPGGVLFAGVPGKVIRKLSTGEIQELRTHPEGYWKIAATYGNFP